MTARQLRFTEEMHGWFDLGDVDPASGREAGRRAGRRLGFHLTILVDDVDRFVADPLTRARAEGWVTCPTLGGKLGVEAGTFNLFVDGPDGTKQMRYRLQFRDAVGHPLTLVGHKHVVGGRLRDLWRQTTTLGVTVEQGHIGDHDGQGGSRAGSRGNGRRGGHGTVGAGIITISPLSFARQLTTFRVSGGPRRDRLRALAAFMELFAGHLWEAFRPRRARAPEAAA